MSPSIFISQTPRRGRVPSPPLRREPPFWCKADREGLGRSPPSVPPNPPWGSKRERLAPLPAFEGPRHAAAMRVVPQRFVCLCLFRETKAFLFLRRGVALMNCPKCGNELSPGWMVPRKICYLEWAPEHWYFPLLPKNKVRLNPTPPRSSFADFMEYPAYLCAACKTVIFEYE